MLARVCIYAVGIFFCIAGLQVLGVDESFFRTVIGMLLIGMGFKLSDLSIK